MNKNWIFRVKLSGKQTFIKILKFWHPQSFTLSIPRSSFFSNYKFIILQPPTPSFSYRNCDFWLKKCWYYLPFYKRNRRSSSTKCFSDNFAWKIVLPPNFFLTQPPPLSFFVNLSHYNNYIIWITIELPEIFATKLLCRRKPQKFTILKVLF